MAAGPITVVVADDQSMVRYGLALIVDHEADLSVVGQASDGQEAIDLVDRLHPDVVLMDVRMPNLDGIDATATVVARSPHTRVVALTTFDDDASVLAALRAGAAGFLMKDVAPEQLVKAIRQVYAGRYMLDPTVTRAVVEQAVSGVDHSGSLGIGAHDTPGAGVTGPGNDAVVAHAISKLTPREAEIWRYVAAGLPNRDIGEELGLTEATVKSHLTALFTKLGVRSRVQAVILAYDCGLVGSPDRVTE